MAEAHDDVAQVFQTLGLDLVALLTFWIRMRRTVYVYGGLAILIEEIRSGIARLNKYLRLGGQAQSTRFEESQPLAFQVRVALARQASQVLNTGECRRRHLDAGTGELQQQFTALLTVEKPVVELVRIAHQAVIARCLTVLTRSWATPQVGAARRVKVTELQCLLRHAWQCLWIVEKAPQGTSAALGCFVEKEDAPGVL